MSGLCDRLPYAASAKPRNITARSTEGRVPRRRVSFCRAYGLPVTPKPYKMGGLDPFIIVYKV